MFGKKNISGGGAGEPKPQPASVPDIKKQAPVIEAAPPKASAASTPDASSEKKSALHDPFAVEHAAEAAAAKTEPADSANSVTTLRLQRARNRIWLDLRDGIDLKALARMEAKAAREEVYSAVEEIARFRNLDLTPAELQSITKECADDMLGFGPLEELLERDDIADIMINGPETIYIEVSGRIERSHIKFRDNQHLTTICQRIVGAIG